MNDDAIGTWVLCAIMTIVSFLGLLLASRAEEQILYGSGLALLVFGILFIAFLIHKVTRVSAGSQPVKGAHPCPRAHKGAPFQVIDLLAGDPVAAVRGRRNRLLMLTLAIAI